MKENTSLLKISQLTKTYGNQLIFKNLDLLVDTGEWVGIVGENGAGKSTFVRIITGFEKYSHGQIYLDGRTMATFSKKEWVQQIQLVTQYTRRALDPTKTIKQLLFEPLKQFQLARKEEYLPKVESVLSRCNLSVDILAKRSLEISGGQYQRICIALALLVQPKLLICDEATSSLDKINELWIIKLLKEQENMAVLFISHNKKLLKEVCDRSIQLEDYK
ncbi:ATP-binding cassette domain-containing protein [Brevibacillus halotolerans]|uniref:ABC transporter ATP-binding protein n=1 Tax=Brevibacillus TaxID=55080 RepID=UPI00215C5351|nr:MULTISPECIES: ATP-binding cassette domain-containing protein [Brevibacillus]MCR8962961.1 ATP-binding cassette domain-containing protein [Brevibacillus laterosporus]MCZ0835117.1 ATP-binding cassette domain-containing protein [Brevibacillus halotolerans]